MGLRPLTVAWISFFPIEWLEDVREDLHQLPKIHPATWQRVLLGELENRPDLDLHIIVLRKHFRRSETFRRNGVTFHLIKTIGGLRAPSFYWMDTFLIRRELRSIDPDLVHAWGTEGGAALVAGRLGCPSFITAQGLLNWIGESVPLNRYDRFHAMLEDVSFRAARVVTAESSFAVDYLKRRYPHLELHQIEHAPLGIFGAVQRAPKLSPRRFVYVGGFNRLKGSDVMIQALDRLMPEMDFELVCAGSVDEAFRNHIASQVSPQLWDRVRFVGSKSSSEVASLLAEAALMIYPTRVDNSPNAVKEAVVAGVPVVASRVGGIVDYVWQGENGFLFEAGNLVECADAIRSACSHSTVSQGIVGPPGLARVRRYLSKELMADRFLELYGKVARGGSAD